MSSRSAPDKTDPGRFAVVVDPSGWPHDLERLAETVRSACRSSAPDRAPPALAALLEKLRAGAATVANDWGRQRAQALQAALRSEGIESKLLRRRPPTSASGAVPPGATGPRRAAPPALPALKAQKAPAGAAPPRPTQMDGWSRFVAPDTDKGGVPRVAPAEVQAARRGGAPASDETSPQARETPPLPRNPFGKATGARPAVSEGLGQMPMLGWGDVLEPGAATPRLGPPPDDAPKTAAVERTEPRLPAHTPREGTAAVPEHDTAPPTVQDPPPAKLPAPAPQVAPRTRPDTPQALAKRRPEADPAAGATPQAPAATPRPRPPEPAPSPLEGRVTLGWTEAHGQYTPVDVAHLGDDAPDDEGEAPRTAPATQQELPVSAAFRALLDMPGRPVPVEELTPSPTLAFVFGVAAPGGGQVYLGQRDEGFRVAVAAPLVLPWIAGARAAWSDAARVAAGQRPPRTRPRPGAALLFVAGVWVCIALLVGGAVWVYRSLTAPTGPAAATAPAPPVALGERVEPPLSEVPDDPPLRATAIADEVEQRQREARARRLTIQAHEACEAGDFPRCLELSDRARRLEPDLHQAVRLFHRASLALEQGTGEGTGEGGTAEWPPEEGSP